MSDTVAVSTSGSVCSSNWPGGAQSTHSASSIYTILITLPPPAATPTGDQGPASSTSASTPESHKRFSVAESEAPVSIKQFSCGGGGGNGADIEKADSGKSSGDKAAKDKRTSVGGSPPRSSSAISQPKSEKKAAKTLSAILLAFVITWTPYNVLVLIKTLSTESGSIGDEHSGLWSGELN